MKTLCNRLARLEGHSPWGSRADLATATHLVMRVPDGGEDDGRVMAARARAKTSGQLFQATASPFAQGMPMWRLVPISRIPDVLLDHLITETQILIEEMEARP